MGTEEKEQGQHVADGRCALRSDKERKNVVAFMGPWAVTVCGRGWNGTRGEQRRGRGRAGGREGVGGGRGRGQGRAGGGGGGRRGVAGGRGGSWGRGGWGRAGEGGGGGEDGRKRRWRRLKAEQEVATQAVTHGPGRGGRSPPASPIAGPAGGTALSHPRSPARALDPLRGRKQVEFTGRGPEGPALLAMGPHLQARHPSQPRAPQGQAFRLEQRAVSPASPHSCWHLWGSHLGAEAGRPRLEPAARVTQGDDSALL